jgi:hypothetical protein
LVERIRRGESAIAKAKAEGRDVPDWEAHLQQLRRLAASASNTTEPTEDPILSVGQWYPEFHRFHMAVVHETPDFDYCWLRGAKPDLYRAIKAKENEIDALGSGATVSGHGVASGVAGTDFDGVLRPASGSTKTR